MQFADPLLIAYILLVACVFGLIMGSFINCWAWRYVRGESVMRGRSHCATCNHQLSARDLVPVFSWLFSGGKCRYCGQKVSARYPATELVCAVVFMAITAKFGVSLETAELLAFACILLFLSLVDLETSIIPNGAIIAALAVRAAYLAAACAMGRANIDTVLYFAASGLGMGIAILVVTLVADRVFGKDSMGGGDLKLFAVAGFYFGWQQGIFLIIVSCVIGIVAALLGLRSKAPEDEPGQPANQDEPAKQDEPEETGVLGKPFPFGPSIAMACVLVMLVGDSVITWYLGFL